MNRDISKEYKGMQERVEEAWLNIRVEKTKAKVQNRRTRKNKHNTEN
jgi:hypothetical protein